MLSVETLFYSLSNNPFSFHNFSYKFLYSLAFDLVITFMTYTKFIIIFSI